MANADADATFANLLPGLPDDVRARVVSEWAQEHVAPAYVRRERTPPRWVERGGMSPEEFRLRRHAEKLRAMGTSDGELGVLRTAVITRSTHTSQQKVASQVRVDAATLHHFRRGRVPSGRTLAKLERWYREAVFAAELEVGSAPGAVLVLKPLLLALPCAERVSAAAELMNDVRRWHLTRGLPLPRWMV